MALHTTPRRPRVVARWAGAARSARPVICDECGDPAVAGDRCPGCYQLAPGRVGMLAAVVDTPAGARLVIAERDPAGRWTPTRTLPATGHAIRAVRRSSQDLPWGGAVCGRGLL